MLGGGAAAPAAMRRSIVPIVGLDRMIRVGVGVRVFGLEFGASCRRGASTRGRHPGPTLVRVRVLGLGIKG